MEILHARERQYKSTGGRAGEADTGVSGHSLPVAGCQIVRANPCEVHIRFDFAGRGTPVNMLPHDGSSKDRFSGSLWRSPKAPPLGELLCHSYDQASASFRPCEIFQSEICGV